MNFDQLWESSGQKDDVASAVTSPSSASSASAVSLTPKKKSCSKAVVREDEACFPSTPPAPSPTVAAPTLEDVYEADTPSSMPPTPKVDIPRLVLPPSAVVAQPSAAPVAAIGSNARTFPATSVQKTFACKCPANVFALLRTKHTKLREQLLTIFRSVYGERVLALKLESSERHAALSNAALVCSTLLKLRYTPSFEVTDVWQYKDFTHDVQITVATTNTSRRINVLVLGDNSAVIYFEDKAGNDARDAEVDCGIMAANVEEVAKYMPLLENLCVRVDMPASFQDEVRKLKNSVLKGQEHADCVLKRERRSVDKFTLTPVRERRLSKAKREEKLRKQKKRRIVEPDDTDDDDDAVIEQSNDATTKEKVLLDVLSRIYSEIGAVLGK